jgi:hypothetical protein
VLRKGGKNQEKKRKKKRPKEVKKEKGWANFISDKLPRFLLDSFLGIFCTKNSVENFSLIFYIFTSIIPI